MPNQLPGEWNKMPGDVRESWRQRVQFIVETYKNEGGPG